MGLIQRQGLKYSIVNWVGVLIGALSTLFLFPNTLEEYGLIRFVLDTSMLLFPLISLGSNSIIVRFFPYFEDKDKEHNGFLGLLFIWGGIGFGVVTVLFFLFQHQISAFYELKNPLLRQYLWIILPVAFFTTINTILFQYANNFKRIVIPSLLFDVSQKFILPVLIIAYLRLDWSISTLLFALVIYLSAVTVGFGAYLSHLKALYLKPNFSILSPELRQQIKDYALFGIVGGLGSIIILKLDSWLVGTYINLKSNGIYSISAFIANVMEIPSRAVISIGITLIARYWKEENLVEIEVLYKKASLNLLIMGLLIFGAFWISVDSFYGIIANSKEMGNGKYVILVLGLGRLIDMATGLNNYILNYSKYFKYSYLQILLPAGISLATGFWLTPLYGMTGAAISTLIAVTSYNGISLFINWHFFRIQPFSIYALKAIGLGLTAFLIVNFIPDIHTLPFLTLVIRSGSFCAFFVLLLYKFHISTDLNTAIDKLIQHIK